MARKSEKLPLIEAVRSEGKISLPPEAKFDSYEALREWSRIKENEENEVVVVSEPAGPLLEGLVALTSVLQAMFGLTDVRSRTVQGFFGSFKVPPELKSLRTGPGAEDVVQVPWGDIAVPSLDGNVFTTGLKFNDKLHGLELTLNAELPRKYAKVIKGIAANVREASHDGSYYRGKAFKSRYFANPKQLMLQVQQFGPESLAPEFMDLASVKPEELIFSDEIQRLMDAAIFTPIKHWNRLQKLGASSKRGVLLSGDPGVGKTMAARVAAKVATNHGATFNYVKEPDQLSLAIEHSKLIGGLVVIFCEDIDRLMVEGRDERVNNLLNTVNGLEAGHEVILVLTTNYIDRVKDTVPEMLRPGRLDIPIHIEPPDAVATMKLLSLYGRGNIVATEAELFGVARRIAGNIPAVVQEIVDRARLFSLPHTPEGETPKIHAPELLLSAHSMEKQIAMLKPPKVQDPDVVMARQLGITLGRELASGLAKIANGLGGEPEPPLQQLAEEPLRELPRPE